MKWFYYNEDNTDILINLDNCLSIAFCDDKRKICFEIKNELSLRVIEYKEVCDTKIYYQSKIEILRILGDSESHIGGIVKKMKKMCKIRRK